MRADHHAQVIADLHAPAVEVKELSRANVADVAQRGSSLGVGTIGKVVANRTEVVTEGSRVRWGKVHEM